MTRVWMVKSLACLMAVVFTASTISAEMHGAMLHVTSEALVNHVRVTSSTAVLDGDQVQVPGNVPAFISMPGTAVSIAPGSGLTYNTNALELADTSGVSVDTTNALAVTVQKLKIAPANRTGKYEVVRAGGSVLVAAKLGPVSLFDGSSMRTVPEGSSASVPDPAPQTTPGAAGGGAGGGHGKAIAIIAALAAAGVAAAVAVATTGTPSSPSVP